MDKNMGIEEMRVLAEQGYSDAQYNLGLMYKEGLGIPQNDYEASDWFAKAAEQGHSDAQYNLGLIYRDGKKTPEVVYMILRDHEINKINPTAQDYKEIFRDFGLDSPESFDCLDVVKTLSEKQGIDRNKAIYWFTRAAAQGNSMSLEWLKRKERIAIDRLAREQYNLGIMYEEGQGVPQDYMKAFECYTKAAEQGFDIAQYNLGAMYEEGKGIPQDSIKATEWYIKAAEQGHSDAQEILFCKYEEGDYFVAQNYHKLNYLFLMTAERGYNRAVEWLVKSAELGDDNIKLTLANMYKEGQGVPQDYTKAVDLYNKVAEKGHADTQLTLANMYKEGQGVDKNYAKAVEWYAKAAEQGIYGAQYNLAIMYEKGLGIRQDMAKANEWHTKAAENEVPF